LDNPLFQPLNFASSNTNTMSATENKQRRGGHTQLFGEQLVTLKDLNEFKKHLPHV